MSAIVLDGRAIAARLRRKVKQRVATLSANGVVPRLAVIVVGDDPASATYVRSKRRLADKVGIRADLFEYSANVDPAEVRARLDALNADDSVHGVLVQLPLPFGPDVERALLDRIDPRKDVDGFHPHNLGRLAAGNPLFVPGTPLGCMRLIAEAGVDPAGKRAVIIGRSLIVGKPLALLLLAAHSTVTVCHSRTRDLPAITREADIVVAAVGRPRLVRGAWIRPGACVIDVGINRTEEGKLVGDVAFDEVAPIAGAITPVPRGVGPMTIACLLDNVCGAAERA